MSLKSKNSNLFFVKVNYRKFLRSIHFLYLLLLNFESRRFYYNLFSFIGTMGNLLCVMSHCYSRGEELLIGSRQHVYLYEQGHFMRLGGIGAQVFPNEPDGTIKLKDISESIHDASNFHSSETKLICLENTHMNCGGVPLKND